MIGINTSAANEDVKALKVLFSEDALIVHLDDGRTVSVPITWYPRLLAGTQAERLRFELIGDGEGIHWPDLDEDISVEGILAGRRSAESGASLARWMSQRKEIQTS